MLIPCPSLFYHSGCGPSRPVHLHEGDQGQRGREGRIDLPRGLFELGGKWGDLFQQAMPAANMLHDNHLLQVMVFSFQRAQS
jgi:hypothetical protein